MKLNKMNKYFGDDFYKKYKSNIDKIWSYLYKTLNLELIDKLDQESFAKIVDTRPIKGATGQVVGEKTFLCLPDRSMLFITKTKDLFKVVYEYVNEQNLRLEEVYTVRQIDNRMIDARELKSGTDRVAISFVEEKINRTSFNSSLNIVSLEKTDPILKRVEKELDKMQLNAKQKIAVLNKIKQNPELIIVNKDELKAICETNVGYQGRFEDEYDDWTMIDKLSVLIEDNNAKAAWHEKINDKLNSEYVSNNYDQNDKDAMEFLKNFYNENSKLVKLYSGKPIVRGRYLSER